MKRLIALAVSALLMLAGVPAAPAFAAPLAYINTPMDTINQGLNTVIQEYNAASPSAAYLSTCTGTTTATCVGVRFAASYTGLTTVTQGKLAVGCDNALTNNSALTLSGGTFDAGSYSNALGTLTLSTGTTNTIALNSGFCRLSFTNMNAAATGWLSVTGTLGRTSLRFGTDANGLTLAQLAKIKASGKTVYLDNQGYLRLIPVGTVLRLL